MVVIGSSIIHIPNKRRRVLIGKYNSKFDLELIPLVLNQKDLLLCTKPILPTILINPLRFQELQLQLSEQSALWKLRDDGLGIEGVDAVSEAIIGCSAPMWHKNNLRLSYSKTSFANLSHTLNVLSYSKDFFRNSFVKIALPLLFMRIESEPTDWWSRCLWAIRPGFEETVDTERVGRVSRCWAYLTHGFFLERLSLLLKLYIRWATCTLLTNRPHIEINRDI